MGEDEVHQGTGEDGVCDGTERGWGRMGCVRGKTIEVY